MLFGLWVCVFMACQAQAATDVEDFLTSDFLKSEGPYPKPLLPPDELYRRTEAVLSHFGSPAETNPISRLRRLDGLQNSTGLRKLLPFLDPQNQFARWCSMDAKRLSASLDRDSKRMDDWSLALKPASRVRLRSSPQAELVTRLQQAARSNPASRLLTGLRIALDPGHMGGKLWDELTGKFVRDAATGERLSEGVLNLQTVMLLEREFQALGAETLVTHRSLGPVTAVAYENLDVRAYARKELRATSLQDWFLAQLEGENSGLFESFEKNVNVKKLFSEASRSNYFILRADLQARAELIEAFKPDITLIVHYDTAGAPGDEWGTNPNGPNRTKVYVAGAYSQTEFATRAARSQFAEHALDPATWEASLLLSRHVVSSMSRGLGIPFDTYGGPGDPVRVEPGIYSRNLALTQRLSAHAVSYLEVLYYNQTKEFNALRKQRHPLVIDGENWPYSDRLLKAVHTIRDGTVAFVKSYRK